MGATSPARRFPRRRSLSYHSSTPTPAHQHTSTPMSAILDTLKQTTHHIEEALPTTLQLSPSSAPPTPAETAQAFLDSIQQAFAAKDVEGIVSHFKDDGWWRDILASPRLLHPHQPYPHRVA